jgi:transcription antitermination factor NusG
MGLTQRELCLDAPSHEGMNWYALTVRHQHERTAQAALGAKRFETLVPLYRAQSQWSDREKLLDLPLFSGYVFCRFPFDERVTVLNTPGVRGVVGFGGKAAAVDESEIGAIEQLARAGVRLSPWPYLKPGDRVRIERGPLRGMSGTLIQERDAFRLVINVELLQRSIAAEIAPDAIVPIERVRERSVTR